MTKFKALIVVGIIINLSACSVFLGQPVERVSKYTDVELCIRLADRTFKYHAVWQWAISDEIKKRELNTSKRCEATYNDRNSRLMRKFKATPVSFYEALNFKEA